MMQTSLFTPLVSFKKRQILQQRIPTIQNTNLQNQQQNGQDTHSLELFIILTINGRRRLFLRQLIQFIIKLLLGCTIILHMDIGPTSSLSHLLTHILVQGCHDGVTSPILHIVTSTCDGNRCAINRADTQHKNPHA